LVILLAAGCGSKPEPVYVTGEDAERIAETVEPIATGILTGIETNDYTIFAAHFAEAMRKSINEETFAKIVNQIGKSGAHESLELLNIEDQGNYYGVNYGVNFSAAKMIMLVVVTKEDPNLVSGLWFK
jgi:hypothetical protein